MISRIAVIAVVASGIVIVSGTTASSTFVVPVAVAGIGATWIVGILEALSPSVASTWVDGTWICGF